MTNIKNSSISRNLKRNNSFLIRRTENSMKEKRGYSGSWRKKSGRLRQNRPQMQIDSKIAKLMQSLQNN